MPRYAKRSPDGVQLFCEALSPFNLSRRDDVVEFDVKTIMPVFEKLADLEDADAKGGTSALIQQHNRFRSLLAEIAKQQLIRYKKANPLPGRVLQSDCETLAERFMLKRKKGILDEDAWNAVIKAYFKNKPT